MKAISSGNDVVDFFGRINITGNVIPETWYQHIKFESGKVDLNAIVLLAEIVYWYRPTERRAETGGAISWQKKFRSDKLQKSYQDLSDKFGLTKRQVRDAIHRLEDGGFLTIEFRDIEVSGLHLSNVLFVEPVPSRIFEITYNVTDDALERDTSYVETGDPPTLERNTPPAETGDVYKDYTEISPKTTHQQSADPSGSDASGSGDPLSEPGSPTASFFWGQFGRQRWATPAQKATFLECEEEVGEHVMLEAVRWAATSNISNVNSICTTARKIGRRGHVSASYNPLEDEAALAAAAFAELEEDG